MMPGDGAMTSIVQRVARQALLTFRSPPRAGEEAGKSFLENRGKLQSLMTEVRAADLRLVPRRADAAPPGPAYPRGAPPVTYMHICETERFSMGVFLLKSGASIPLHDHPGMHGVLRVLYGKARISCFDRPDPRVAPPQPLPRPAARSVLRSTGEFTEESGPCVLGPDRDNLHQIDAVDGPTAFMDILAPPYDPDDGRDCHYYKVLPGPEAWPPGQKGQEGQEVWLVEISQPPDFWCGGEPYPGPEVHL